MAIIKWGDLPTGIVIEIVSKGIVVIACAFIIYLKKKVLKDRLIDLSEYTALKCRKWKKF